MRINGDRPTLNEEVVVLPRPEGKDIVFRARAVLSYDDFNKMVPSPIPPTAIDPEGKKFLNIEDLEYKAAQVKRFRQENAWMLLKSLEATPGLTWEVVNMQQPDTWLKWHEELKESNLSAAEIELVFRAVWDANCLNNDKVKAARDRFLSSRAVKQEKKLMSSVSAAHTPSVSSVPANGSTSILPAGLTVGTTAP